MLSDFLDPLLFSGVCVLGMVSLIEYSHTGRGPVQLLIVGLLRLSALWLLLKLMARAAWGQRNRWGRCLRQAKKNAGVRCSTVPHTREVVEEVTTIQNKTSFYDKKTTACTSCLPPIASS